MNKHSGYSIKEMVSLKPKGSRLTPVRFGEDYRSPGGHKRRMVVCVCDCGKEHSVDVTYFKSGKIKSCGCYMRDKSNESGYNVDDINRLKPADSSLTALRYAYNYHFPSGQQARHFVFKCNCGKEIISSGGRVISGNTKSCGCRQAKKYGPERYYLNLRWHGMIGRCYRKSYNTYEFYGAKGVRVCKEWRGSGGFENFYRWSLKNGWQLGLQLDKDIKGNGKLYSPKTCSWVTPVVNCNHRSVTKRYCFSDGNFSIRDMCDYLEVEYRLLISSLVNKKHTVDDAINYSLIRTVSGDYGIKLSA